jgi:hypothetical protein
LLEGFKGARDRDQARLDPQKLFSVIEDAINRGCVAEEVLIRRAISAIYFALFNYWAEKRYGKGER